MSKFIDLTGQKFGRLTVVERGENANDGHTRWKCSCECGSNKIVLAIAKDLKKGHTKSCGCIQREKAILAGKSKKTHGKTNTRLFNIWHGMKQRCYDKTSCSYELYGKRGIRICDEWCNSFQAFYDWSMQNGYAENLSIDRIDINGNYSPDNCRWTTMKVQQNNKRNNRLVTYKGETLTVTQWSERTGIKLSTLVSRLNSGWDIEKALNKSTS